MVLANLLQDKGTGYYYYLNNENKEAINYHLNNSTWFNRYDKFYKQKEIANPEIAEIEETWFTYVNSFENIEAFTPHLDKAEAENISNVKSKVAAINKKMEEATITTFEPLKGMTGRRLAQGQKWYDEARALQGKTLINSPFLEGEPTVVSSFNDSSLGKFTNTNNAPADMETVMVQSGIDRQNYTFH